MRKSPIFVLAVIVLFGAIDLPLAQDEGRTGRSRDAGSRESTDGQGRREIPADIDALVKLVKLDDVPDARPAPGGIAGATGYRYFTMHVTNLEEVMDACVAAVTANANGAAS